MAEQQKHLPDNKLEAPEIAERSGFLRWLENFWYHYKWQTLLVGFILLVIIGTFVQCSSNEKTDLSVTMATGKTLTEAEMNAVIGILEGVLPADYDGSGDKKVALIDHLILSPEELEILSSYEDEDGNVKVNSSSYWSNKGYNDNRIDTLQTFVTTGESAVWFVSPYVYNLMLYNENPGRVNWVRESVALKDTAFYAHFGAIQALPEDTVVVLMHKPQISAMTAEEYEQAVEYYHAIVNFSAP